MGAHSYVERFGVSVVMLSLTCTVVAFWPTYFSHPFSGIDPFVAAHATIQTGWLLVLIGQALAIFTGRLGLHRAIGEHSGVFIVVNVATTLALMQHRLQGTTIDDVRLQVVGFNVATVCASVAFYWLAMRHRLNRDLHAALMCATVLPAFTAFGSRFLEHSPALVNLSIRAFGGVAALNQMALVPADLLLVVASLWDWRQSGRLTVFPVLLLLLVGLHFSPVVFAHLAFWRPAVQLLVTARVG